MIITQMTADNLSILIDYYLSHTATCPPGSIYEECLIQCSQFCPPMANRPDLSARCEEDSCIPGCDDGTVTCDPPKMWLAPGVCVDETLCPCVDGDGSTVSVRGPPIQYPGGGAGNFVASKLFISSGLGGALFYMNKFITRTVLESKLFI